MSRLLRFSSLRRAAPAPQQHSVSFRPQSSAALPDLKLTSLSVSESDPELFALLNREVVRQKSTLNLSPLENYASRATLDTVQTVLQNKYSEGYPRARYYGGNENVDDAEELCQSRALQLFGLSSDEWSVNVQSLSNSISNLESLTAVLTSLNENNPHNLRILALRSDAGGDVCFGSDKKSDLVKKLFNIIHFGVDKQTQLVDYANLSDLSEYVKPNVIACGNGLNSGYPRVWDYERISQVCKKNASLMLCDISDVAGLIATGLLEGNNSSVNPFDYADIVTCAPSTSLRGPKGAAMIFSRKSLGSSIDMAVFPGHQGGPHNHAISALGTSLLQAMSEEFVGYQKQCLENAKVLGDELANGGMKLLTGGTDTSTVVVDNNNNNNNSISNLNNFDENSISIFYDDESNTVRMSSLAMTTRGLTQDDFKTVAQFVNQAAKGETNGLGEKVTEFVQAFELPGADDL